MLRAAVSLRRVGLPLAAGEMFVVPRCVEHRPVAQSECRTMLVEPRGVVNTGEPGGSLMAERNQWI